MTSSKRILAAAVVAWFGNPVALAQAPVAPGSVQLYGIVDAGLNIVTGLRGGTDRTLASGIMEGSRWGLTGTEDLGGGWRAFFRLESRFEVDTGGLNNRPASGLQVPDRLSNATLLGLPSSLQPVVTQVAGQLATTTVGVNLGNSFWDRQAYVGLITPVGAVLLGRQYTPAYEMAASFDTTGTQSSLAVGQIASLPPGYDIRFSNALAYRAVVGPLSVALMYGFGQTPGDIRANRLIGGNAIYKTDAYSLGIGYNRRNNELGEKSLTSLVLGATAQVGPGTANVFWGSIRDDNPAGLSGLPAQLTPALQAQGLSPTAAAATAALVQNAFITGLRQDAKLFNVGYKFKTGRNTLYLVYNRYDDDRPADADTQSYGVVWSYELSPRTDLNAVAARYVNDGLAQAAPGGNGFVGGVTAVAGRDSNNVALGIRHRF